ncbi:MAG: D-alanine-D-alanine ligase [Candidatus Collierbacteria bacterium GW2011_GWF1_44_12]|uniref:D-alanine--D-alanine ligase n=1 Tax=Candidatus Collierbacteria bacterium GW2011_GWF1_44_12 TaxID=1618402 RepID=A0A0G1GXB7_9BACT|nr:MAG: D-alanine-D-alanine ligase [Candidatus Collierbacteria bacterium GW2011_GWF1_44_12]
MVLYGGVSPEHEVAIISAGEWFMGGENYLKPDFYKDLEKVKSSGKQVILSANRGWGLMQKGLLGFAPVGVQIDVVFPVFHGSNGEDGTIQGLLELANLPYVFSGVLGGSAGMDKYVTKRVAEGLGMNVAPDKLVVREGWNESKLKTVLKEVKFPVFVKPATLGSTIGITRVEKPSELGDAIEVGFHYDDRVLVEDGIDLEKEVNISVLGNGPYEVSVTEQPVTKDKLLSFKDKYIASSSSKTQGMASAKRMIPAPITKEQQATIEKWSRNIFRAINGKGLARVDFIIDEKGKVYFNEINTIPGSLSFYLWERSGYPFGKLVTKLIQLAEESWEEKQKKVTVFESNILAGLGRLGVKGKA